MTTDACNQLDCPFILLSTTMTKEFNKSTKWAMDTTRTAFKELVPNPIKKFSFVKLEHF